jgi:hypothetical protein
MPASYKRVSVYDNGLIFFRSHRKNYGGDGWYFGEEWQCAEFIKRFHYEAKKHIMPDGCANNRLNV